MRLTLRTLLAYLDDTLEPTEIKQIGQKVAESDAAQELIARIKSVTRKRRLTTPPLTGPGAKFDPNLIAEYLDNELSGEQVAEIEKVCLESDVHLAEIAACHQILTLVLGEPALVPPTARERMYGLVKGREAIPFRKASAKNPNAVGKHDDNEAEETAVLGLPVHKRQAGWLKWAIPAACLLLFVALGVALYTALRDTHPNKEQQQVANNNDKTNGDKTDKDKEGKTDKTNTDKTNADKPNTDKPDADKPNTDKPITDKPDADKPNADKPNADKPNTDKPNTDKPNTDKPNTDKPNTDKTPMWPTDRPPEPSKERHEVATYVGSPRMGAPSVLVARPRETDPWMRVKPNGRVSTADTLVSLPGYSSELRTEKGVHLELWGTLPEFNPTSPTCPYLFESAVTLHHNPKVDLEFTLERGRVYISNHKDNNTPALIRIRFKKEVWDLNLNDPDTEIVLELVTRYTDNINYRDGEEPFSYVSLLVLSGTAGMKYDNYQEIPNLQGPPGPAFVAWDNKGHGPAGPFKIEKDNAIITLLGKVSATTQGAKALTAFRPALEEVSGLLLDPKRVDVVLYESEKTSKFPNQKALCIYCLGAIDDVAALLDILGSEDKNAEPEREEAIIALRRWTSRGPQTTKILYDIKTDRGLLRDKGYSPINAESMLQLLYLQLSDATARRKDTYETLAVYLRHSKMPIRELAYYQLKQLTFGLKGMPAYDPAASQADRNRVADEWDELIKKGVLPPTAPPAPPPMPPK